MKRFLLNVLLIVAALIPTWFYLFLRFVLNPQGFWQNFVLLGVGLYYLGGIQLIFLIVLAFLLYAINS